MEEWETSTALLIALREGDEDWAWSALLERVARPALRFACGLGLETADAEDVVQDALASFVRAYRNGRYDRTRGRLGTWFFGFLNNKARKALRDPSRTRWATGDAVRLDALPEREECFECWDEEWQNELARMAWERVGREVEPRTFAAVEEFLVQGRPADEIARQLGMSRNAVYKAKSRVVARMNEIIQQLEEVAGGGNDSSAG